MKFLIIILLLLVTAPTLPAQQDGIAQSSELITVAPGDKFLRWYGHGSRSYFVQVSDANNPLAKWFWAPIIEAGNDEEISYEVDGTAPTGFFRLKYTDQLPGYGETLDTADFDNDGISNLHEISPPVPYSTHGATDPLKGDTDEDGMSDGSELAYGFNPNNSDENNDSEPDGLGDNDNDGISNVEENILGSDPKTNSPTDRAIQNFAKKTFVVIPLATAPTTGVSRYRMGVDNRCR